MNNVSQCGITHIIFAIGQRNHAELEPVNTHRRNLVEILWVFEDSAVTLKNHALPSRNTDCHITHGSCHRMILKITTKDHGLVTHFDHS